MQYRSTRGDSARLNFSDAVLTGLAPDGGLYLPTALSPLPTPVSSDYPTTAAQVLGHLAPEINTPDLTNLISQSLRHFTDPAIAPLRQLQDNLYLLELFHSPTLAFKDYALQGLGLMLDSFLQRHHHQLTIIGATSGDTGAAAIAGCAHLSQVSLFILYPHDRVAPFQRRQMTTATAPNVHAIAIDGTFDDCQSLVKTLLHDKSLGAQRQLAAVNSINWGRVAWQVVYYMVACARLGKQPVSFVVPTGNFGNIYAGWIAKKLGAPIDKLIAASNSNDTLCRFLQSGVLKPQAVQPTYSPSMDIQIPSNLERLLFSIFDDNPIAIRELYKDLQQGGRISISPDAIARLQTDFIGYSADNARTLAEISYIYQKHNIIIDPHTAVGMAASRDYLAKHPSKVVSLSCAHPAKFPQAIEKAINITPTIPPSHTAILSMKERIIRFPNHPDTVKSYILSH